MKNGTPYIRLVLLRDIRFLFEVAGTASSEVIRISIARIRLIYVMILKRA